MKRSMVCIACPVGCRLEVSDESGKLTVKGNACPRGRAYGISETSNPVRMVTSSVPVMGGATRMASVRTAEPVPKALIPDVLAVIRAVKVSAPIRIGQVLARDAAGSGIDIIATRGVEMRRDV